MEFESSTVVQTKYFEPPRHFAVYWETHATKKNFQPGSLATTRFLKQLMKLVGVLMLALTSFGGQQ